MEKLKSVYSNVEGLPPDRIVPTVGLNIGRIEVSNSKLVFWDLGGQACERNHQYFNYYYYFFQLHVNKSEVLLPHAIVTWTHGCGYD